ncbi:hypothetical protein [Phenylobacterium sp.]|uniref:hypothetical protein n=1 Tax=Phenylobacterium sp. TaxID=1871053 RepID=UPI0025FC3A61|nr:hypothetical protein [Phenylobacterium sp.]
MGKKPTLAQANAAAAPVAVEPVEAASVGAEPEVVVPPAEGAGLAGDDASARLAQLFARLKITKIVFVDDKAELQTDAGAVIKVLAAKGEAKEPLAGFFPGIALTLENDALLEQLAARLGELDADGLAALRGVLSAQSDDAAEREALGRLQDLLPEGTIAHLLTPHAWHERRDALMEECTEDRRTLFLFDQELEVDDAALGFAKGSDIIRDMAEKERTGFGTRWFCGMLTHTVAKGEEVASWQGLAKKENLDLRFFMPIAKTTLDDAPAFYGAVYRTLINTYCQTMKSLASEAFEHALKDALERFSDLDPIDFEHMVVNSSGAEGVSELETLIRLYGIIQKDQVKTQILQQARVGEFAAAARAAKEIADIGRVLSATSQERLHKLRREELYEGDHLVNSYHDPLRNGDLFEIGEGNDVKLWVLVAQPCDLMVRSNGKRAREENFKVAVLAPVRTRPLGEASGAKDGLNFSLEHYDHGGAQSAIVQFAEATPANLQVLDLAVFNKDGHCQLAAEPDPALSVPSRAWEKRDAELRGHFGKVTSQIEAARKAHKDAVADLLATAIMPRGAPKKAFAKYGAYASGAFTYPIRRCGRIRDPLATSLLSAYSRFLARDAYEHDFSKAE